MKKRALNLHYSIESRGGTNIFRVEPRHRGEFKVISILPTGMFSFFCRQDFERSKAMQGQISSEINFATLLLMNTCVYILLLLHSIRFFCSLWGALKNIVYQRNYSILHQSTLLNELFSKKKRLHLNMLFFYTVQVLIFLIFHATRFNYTQSNSSQLIQSFRLINRLLCPVQNKGIHFPLFETNEGERGRASLPPPPPPLLVAQERRVSHNRKHGARRAKFYRSISPDNAFKLDLIRIVISLAGYYTEGAELQFSFFFPRGRSFFPSFFYEE